MSSTARDLHQKAMDLYDFGRIYRAKGYSDHYYTSNLALAYMLDREAALKIQTETTDIFWKAAYARSAGWLAYKSEKYLEAKEFAELGLSHRDAIGGYETLKLEELLAAANKKIKELKVKTKKIDFSTGILGKITSANVEELSLQVRALKGGKTLLVQVEPEKIIWIARLYLGDTVEIALEKDEQGKMILQDIRRAA